MISTSPPLFASEGIATVFDTTTLPYMHCCTDDSASQTLPKSFREFRRFTTQIGLCVTWLDNVNVQRFSIFPTFQTATRCQGLDPINKNKVAIVCQTGRTFHNTLQSLVKAYQSCQHFVKMLSSLSKLCQQLSNFAKK